LLLKGKENISRNLEGNFRYNYLWLITYMQPASIKEEKHCKWEILSSFKLAMHVNSCRGYIVSTHAVSSLNLIYSIDSFTAFAIHFNPKHIGNLLCWKSFLLILNPDFASFCTSSLCMTFSR
jgi:hypothetical protein